MRHGLGPKTGLTLVGLLVVMTIIVALAALLFPVLAAEVPAFIPFSWHWPKRPVPSSMNEFFNNAMHMVSFVDGHVSYLPMYWKTAWPPTSFSSDYNPPEGYDYQRTGD